jgi:LysR family glycine cleavage system transcriptional activator
MDRPLPSLIALRVFEIAGKLQSFSNAAIELNVTQGAVSRQIRALEDELTVKLFTRLTRKVELTEAGRKYLPEVQAAFRQIEQATARLRAHETHSILTVSVLPSVGTYWLMPRLARFTQQHPNIEIRITSSIDPVDLQSHGADVAIRVGPMPGRQYDPGMPQVDLIMTMDWRGILAEELVPDILVPVYSPDLIPESEPVTDPGFFLNFPIIHTGSRPDAWAGWSKAYGLPAVLPQHQIEYGHFFMSLEAARQGLGVALVPDLLLSEINSNDLVIVRAFSVKSAGEYYALSLNSRSQEQPVFLFRQWLKEQFDLNCLTI